MRILLADDHQIVRQGLRGILEKAGHVVVGEAADGHEALKLARTLNPAIAVLDFSIPLRTGLATARAIHPLSPPLALTTAHRVGRPGEAAAGSTPFLSHRSRTAGRRSARVGAQKRRKNGRWFQSNGSLVCP